MIFLSLYFKNPLKLKSSNNFTERFGNWNTIKKISIISNKSPFPRDISIICNNSHRNSPYPHSTVRSKQAQLKHPTRISLNSIKTPLIINQSCNINREDNSTLHTHSHLISRCSSRAHLSHHHRHRVPSHDFIERF